MSRSYKKPYNNNERTKYAKRQANKRVRKHKEVGDYGLYKKVYESYEIRDYCYYCDEPIYRRK